MHSKPVAMRNGGKMIKGIYHVWPENYQLIKDLGFTHAGVSMDYPQDHDLFLRCVHV